MDVKKKIVLLNVITSGGQVVFIGLVYFLLYRYLLSQLGIELLGVWSVVLSTSSLANLANFGVADSVVRFVALYSGEKDDEKIKQLAFTATIFLAALFLTIAAIIYPFAGLILKSVLPAKYVNEGLSILPFSLLCLIINAVNGVYASVLDGMQKNYIRNIIFSLSSILLLVGTYALTPSYHLKGVAFAQVAQSLFTLLACLTVIIVRLKFNPIKWAWNKQIFKEIFSYGMKFQFISLAAMVNEPIVKILLGKFGGMAFTGYYEMANRLISQARGVIVSATQSMIPLLVNVSKEELPAFYRRTLSNVMFFSITVVCGIVISGRWISFYWIGKYEPIFYYTLIILAFCTFINLLCSPSYFYYMAKAKLNLLIKNHMVISVLNAAVGFSAGYFFGGYGVVGGWVIGLLTGSVLLIIDFHSRNEIRFLSLITRTDLVYFGLLAGLALVDGVFFETNYKIVDPVFLVMITLVFAYTLVRHKISEIRGN